MAEEPHHKSHECESNIKTDEVAVEIKDRGLFDFMGNKEEEKTQEEVIITEFEKVQVSQPEPKIEEHKEEKHGLLEKLHRSDSSSSSSSEEEEEEGAEKKEKTKKKRKGKAKIDKISGEKEKEEVEEHHEDTSIPVEKCDDVVHPEEKKGFLEKIKEKLPGQHKKTEEVANPPPPAECAAAEVHGHEGEPKDKKGILEKIKEKLPGYHPKTEEKDTECASH